MLEYCCESACACGRPCCLVGGHLGRCACEGHSRSNSVPPRRHGGDRGHGAVLLDLAVDPYTTAKAYKAALQLFTRWLREEHGWESKALADSSPHLYDDLLAMYLQGLWAQVTPRVDKGKAGATVSAVQDAHPHLKRQLPASWRTVASWNFQEPGELRTIWPLVLALGVARVLAKAGQRAASLCILVMFHCILRPGEAAALQLKHFLGAQMLAGLTKAQGLLAIVGHKTQRRTGRAHHVLVECPALLAELSAYCASLGDPEAFLFPSYVVLHKLVKKVLDQLLGVGHTYTLAGLRGGGATYIYLRDRNIPDLMRRGRWTSIKTLEHYIQLAGAGLTQHGWSEQTIEKLTKLAEPRMALLVG